MVTKKRHTQESVSQMLAPPIFPGRRQPGIVGRNELNCRVRNGNGWTLALIGTNFTGRESASFHLRPAGLWNAGIHSFYVIR